MSTKTAGALDDLRAWYDKMEPDQQYALAGSLIGGTSMGALNMLRAGRGKRLQGFLSGAALGGLGGAGAGLAAHRIGEATAAKPPEGPPPVRPIVVTDANVSGAPGPAGGGDPAPTGLLPSLDSVLPSGRRVVAAGGGAGLGALSGGTLSAAKRYYTPGAGLSPLGATRAGFGRRALRVGGLAGLAAGFLLPEAYK